MKHSSHPNFPVKRTETLPHEHFLEVSSLHPDECNEKYSHNHTHGPDCEHEAATHGDHIDYIVDGRLHHQHGGHCDDHGAVEVILN